MKVKNTWFALCAKLDRNVGMYTSGNLQPRYRNICPGWKAPRWKKKRCDCRNLTIKNKIAASYARVAAWMTTLASGLWRRRKQRQETCPKTWYKILFKKVNWFCTYPRPVVAVALHRLDIHHNTKYTKICNVIWYETNATHWVEENGIESRNVVRWSRASPSAPKIVWQTATKTTFRV